MVFGGLLLGPLGLLAAVGLSDRKLRNYIRQIGESQGAIKEDIKSLTTENIDKEQLGESTISDIENSKEEFKKFLNERLIKYSTSEQCWDLLDRSLQSFSSSTHIFYIC